MNDSSRPALPSPSPPDGWRRWNVRASACVLAALLAQPAWNLATDPYGVFGMPWPLQGPFANERYLKVRHLIGAAPRPDSFLAGSSVMGAVDPQAVARRLGWEEGRTYNLSFFAAKPGEVLQVLRGLKANGIPVRNLVYGIEPFAFTGPEASGPAYWQHPVAGGRPAPGFWLDYLAIHGFMEGLEKVRGNLWLPSLLFDWDKGTYAIAQFKRERAADPAAYVRSRLRGQDFTAPGWVDSRFAGFAELARWLRDNGVAARYHLNPLSPAVARAFGEDRLSPFRQKLAALAAPAGLADCTHTLDAVADEAFADAKHFRPAFSGQVMDCALAGY